MDPYIGAILGYNVASVKWSGGALLAGTDSGSGVIYGGHAGARYLLT